MSKFYFERISMVYFDPTPLEEIDLDPFDIGLVAPKGASNRYHKGIIAWAAFRRGYNLTHGTLPKDKS